MSRLAVILVGLSLTEPIFKKFLPPSLGGVTEQEKVRLRNWADLGASPSFVTRYLGGLGQINLSERLLCRVESRYIFVE